MQRNYFIPSICVLAFVGISLAPVSEASANCNSYVKLADQLEHLAGKLRCNGVGNSTTSAHMAWCKKQDIGTLRIHEENRKKKVISCLKSSSLRKRAAKSCNNYGKYAWRMESGLKALGCASVVTPWKRHRNWCKKQRKSSVRRHHQKLRGDALAQCVAKQRMPAPKVVKSKKKTAKRPTFSKHKPSGSDPGGGRPGGGQTGGDNAGGKKEACVWKTSDINHDTRIDYRPNKDNDGAQYTLMRKMHGDEAEIKKASAIISAVKSGKLAGVMTEMGATKRLERVNPKGTYWTLVPNGRDAFCWKLPANEPPMIVYEASRSAAQIDAAILQAWTECGLPTPEEPCSYVVNLWKPPKEHTELKDKECPVQFGQPDFGNQVCIEKYGTARRACVSGQCKPCRFNVHCEQTSTENPNGPKANYCDYDFTCTWAERPKKHGSVCYENVTGLDCPPGYFCRANNGTGTGLCAPNSHPERACLLAAGAKRVEAASKCDAEELKAVKKCIFKLAFGAAKSADPISLLKTGGKYAICHWEGIWKKDQCWLKATKTQTEDINKCKAL